MTVDADATELGPWDASDLLATAQQFFGLGADTDLPDPIRLLTAVDRVTAIRRANATTDPPIPAVFLLFPTPPESVIDRTRSAPMVDNGLTQLSSRVWFVNAVVYRGRYLDFEYADDAALFQLVEETLQCGAAAAIVYEPRTTPATLRFYPAGLANPDACTVLELDRQGEVDVESVLGVIDDIHKNLLITPDAQDAAGDTWADAARGRPAVNAEARIQMHLRSGLTVAFLGCRVRKEQPGIPGRLDLQIERSDTRNAGQVTIFVVLELKVLRAFWNTGSVVRDAENTEAVEKGVYQAAAYRDDRNARAAALCCFDMRREDTGDHCFDAVRDVARNRDVTLRSWHLFWSSDDYRRRPGA